MGNYKELKQAISDVIKTNGNQEITGAIMQNALLSIISTVGSNATFAGIATPETNPGTPDQNVFYIATENGIYSNFGGITIQDDVVIFSNKNGSWQKNVTGIAAGNNLLQIEKELENIKISTQGVIINSDGITPNLSYYVWADVKLPLLANVEYLLKISGNLTLDSSSVSPYYQIVGTNLQSQESIIDTYISKRTFVEENVEIKPTQDVYLRIRVRGYKSGEISIEVNGEVLRIIEDLQNKINNISTDTVKGLFEKKEQIFFEVKDNYLWSSPNTEPIARPDFSCNTKY